MLHSSTTVIVSHSSHLILLVLRYMRSRLEKKVDRTVTELETLPSHRTLGIRKGLAFKLN